MEKVVLSLTVLSIRLFCLRVIIPCACCWHSQQTLFLHRTLTFYYLVELPFHQRNNLRRPLNPSALGHYWTPTPLNGKGCLVLCFINVQHLLGLPPSSDWLLKVTHGNNIIYQRPVCVSSFSFHWSAWVPASHLNVLVPRNGPTRMCFSNMSGGQHSMLGGQNHANYQSQTHWGQVHDSGANLPVDIWLWAKIGTFEICNTTKTIDHIWIFKIERSETLHLSAFSYISKWKLFQNLAKWGFH